MAKLHSGLVYIILLIKCSVQLFIFFTIHTTAGFQYNICNYTTVQHETHNDHTCCRFKDKKFVTKSSFSLSDHWEHCAVEPNNPTENALTSAWRVYNCSLTQYLRGKPMSLRSVIEVMAKSYPHAVKTAIMSKVEGVSEDEFNDGINHDYKWTNILRDMYYNIEQQVCSENYIVPRREGLGLCDVRDEMYHRNGGCCDDFPLPFQFLYNPFRYGEDEQVNICVEKLLQSVGNPISTNLFSQARYLCYPTCEYITANKLSYEDLWEEQDMEYLIEQMVPTYISSDLKTSIEEYILAQRKQKRHFKRTHSSEKPSSIEPEFSDLDKDKAEMLFSSCATHRAIESLINEFLQMECEEFAISQLELEFWEEFGTLVILSRNVFGK